MEKKNTEEATEQSTNYTITKDTITEQAAQEEKIEGEIEESVETKKLEKEIMTRKGKPEKSRQAFSTPSVEKSKPFDTDYLMGKFNPNSHPDFSSIAGKYASKGGMRMRTDAYKAYQEMFKAAKKDGVTLKIISATRPFHHQKSIWEAKWNGQRKVDGKMLSKNMEPKQKAMKILRWSSMPGTSRHHWGTDVDINNLNNSYFESGKGKKEYDWLITNASTYGFCQVYSVMDQTRPDGYQEEKWHWSYIPVARELTQLYKQKLSNGDIGGFTGSESAELIDVKTKYVLGINPKCE
ncbi:MAG: M15 family metallopeptidase [Saprospiraceae bacterium]